MGKILHAAAGLASQAETLLRTTSRPIVASNTTPHPYRPALVGDPVVPTLLSAAQAQQIYQTYIRRWRIPQRFQPPDWSIVDLWVARDLLAHGMLVFHVQEVLRLGSPAFPRRHSDPADYLRRTLARAFPSFPAPRGTVWAPQAGTPTAAAASDRSNSTGAR